MKKDDFTFGIRHLAYNAEQGIFMKLPYLLAYLFGLIVAGMILGSMATRKDLDYTLSQGREQREEIYEWALKICGGRIEYLSFSEKRVGCSGD